MAPTLRAASAVLLLLAGAGGTRLRHPAEPKPDAKSLPDTPQPSMRRRCDVGGHGSSLLQGVYADGFSRVACEVDIAPEGARINFKDHACGNVSSCGLLELPMQPRMCFDFCRQYASARFFGLQGSRCYCSPYFHPKSTGGEGTCSFACEGDTKEMCGGPSKSSLFEMHLCGDSADEADFALERSGLSIEEAYASARAANATSAKLQELAQAWQLDVCSIAPEGQRVCALPQLWLEASNRAYVAATQVGFQADKLVEMSEGLSAIQSEAKVAGESINASLASSLELATKAVLDASAKAKGTATGVNVTLVGLGGPITKEAFADSMSVFKQLSNASAKWHAVCALEPIKGEAYAALTDDSPAPCASRCLSLSSGLSACAAFNYQYKDGLAACQLLSATGLVQPLLLKAVPVFEVSETKRDAMGLASLGCYASGGFLAGHPQGPLGVKVVRQVVVH